MKQKNDWTRLIFFGMACQLILIITVYASCMPKEDFEKARISTESLPDFEIVKVRNCEYVVNQFARTPVHAGDCTNPEHKK
jgi:hypothetical protein